MNIIVAMGSDGSIGRGGDLIWHIPADLKRFKSLTTGHPVIMGRKTWDSLPKRPLPGRPNIVITRNPEFQAAGATVVHSAEEAAEVAKQVSSEVPFVMGGAQVYSLFMPMATKVYLTYIDAGCPDADVRLEWDPTEWSLEEETPAETAPDGTRFSYMTFARKK